MNWTRHGLWALALLASACTENEAARSKVGVPCDVADVIAEKCGSCHGKTPSFGAPMSLATQADFTKTALDGERTVAEAVAARIHDEEAPMPPIGQPELSATERAKIDAWLADGAPRSEESCVDKSKTDDSAQEFDLSECDELIELRAHENDGEEDTAPYVVPQSDDHYECFYFAVPWQDHLQALRVDPLIDDARVLHHWLLYEEPADGQVGSRQGCSGTHPNASLVAGWAPGGAGNTMPKDVGLRMPTGPDRMFTLEIHYNNSARYEDAADRSGARICATRKLRKNEAAAHWLGTDVILLGGGRSDVRSECRPRQTAHILSTSPHMHKLGRHMSTIITRANGKEETLVDKAFSFDDQQVYPADGVVDVGPGDVLRTTCTYDNDTGGIVTFGSATTQEMCYNFVVAYPVGSLDTGGSFLGGDNKCMQ